MAEFKSESGADFIPESVAGLLRNQQVLDKTAKAAELLIRLGQSDTATLTKQEVDAVARAAHLIPALHCRPPVSDQRRELSLSSEHKMSRSLLLSGFARI
jgi:hypothetical protein